MLRLAIVGALLMMVIGSGLGVVYTVHQSRMLFLEQQQLSEQRDEATAEWTRLRIEQAWLAEASRVEQIARGQLSMDAPKTIKLLVSESD